MKYGLIVTLLLALLLAATPASAGEGCRCGKSACSAAKSCHCAKRCPQRGCSKDCDRKRECECTCPVKADCASPQLLPDAPQEGPWIIDPNICPRESYTLCLDRADFELLRACGCAKEKCSCNKPRQCDCGKKRACGCNKAKTCSCH